MAVGENDACLDTAPAHREGAVDPGEGAILVITWFDLMIEQQRCNRVPIHMECEGTGLQFDPSDDPLKH